MTDDGERAAGSHQSLVVLINLASVRSMRCGVSVDLALRMSTSCQRLVEREGGIEVRKKS